MNITFFWYPDTWISWILIFFGYLDNWIFGYHGYLDIMDTWIHGYPFSLDTWILGYFGYQFFPLSIVWISYPSIRIFLDTFLNYWMWKKGNQIQLLKLCCMFILSIDKILWISKYSIFLASKDIRVINEGVIKILNRTSLLYSWVRNVKTELFVCGAWNIDPLLDWDLEVLIPDRLVLGVSGAWAPTLFDIY